MKTSKRIQRPPFRIAEALERRVQMDGNVTATLQSGDLVVRGDDADNHIVISRASSTMLRIRGREGTTINGQSSVFLQRITDDLSIRMLQGGEDLVAVQGPFNVPDDVTAEMGDGELLIEGSLGAVTIGGDLTAVTGEEAVVNVRNAVAVGGEMSIESGGEANVVSGVATVPNFSAARFNHSLNINNPYFPLVVGTRYTYDAAGIDDDTDEPFTERIVVEVTNQTKLIQGVTTRVVRDRVFDEDGLLIEDTFDWYGQDDNGNVWYFGEDTKDFEYDENGNVISIGTAGSWIAGVDNAQAGTIMEARPRVGHRYYQEFAPGDVLDTGVGVSTNGRARVPVGKYTNLFRSEEATVTEPQVLANKLYAPGVGTIVEFDYDLEDSEVVQTTRLVALTLNGQPVRRVVSPSGFTGTNASGRAVGGATVGGAAEIEAADAVVINGAEFDDDLAIDTEDKAFIVNADLSGDAAIAAEDAVSLRNVFADGTVRVGGRSDVFIFDSQINRLNGRFGGANNDVVITNSFFDMVDADGGGGDNTFNDQGGNSYGTLRLRRFTEV